MSDSLPIPPPPREPTSAGDRDDAQIRRLEADVAKTGYASEIIVASIFREAGWLAIDHVYYMDRDENKGREIDVVAVKENTAESERKKLLFGVGLAVEVKRARRKPWIVFTTERTHWDNLGGIVDTVYTRMHAEEIWWDDLYANHPASGARWMGRASYQAFAGPDPKDSATHKPRNKSRDEQDHADTIPTFGAFVSCMKASTEIVSIYRERDKLPLWDENKKSYEVRLAHGLIVLDGGLFQASVSENRKVSLAPADWISYVFNFASKEYGYKKRLVDIVTIAALPAYLHRYNAWIGDRTDFVLAALS